tara:strand:+ start:43 stop:942 length:900 start_codon:yes stop_codon:yes gene_type:complete
MPSMKNQKASSFLEMMIIPIKFLRGILIFLSLFLFIILINIVQITSILFIPLSKKTFRKINTFLAGSWWSTAEWMMRKSGIKVVISGDELTPRENIILISNHQGMSDIPVLFKLAKEMKQIDHMKWFIKDIIKYVPGIGWGMLFLDGLFLKRNWDKDKHKIEDTFKKFFKNNIPIWLILFPEGTRFRPEKLKLMERIAKSKKLPPLNHVLLPRAKGFTASIQGLRGHCKTVLDATIIYEGSAPTITDLVLGKVSKVHLHVKRFELEELTNDKNELNHWITQRFYIKDEMIRKFQKNGNP